MARRQRRGEACTSTRTSHHIVPHHAASHRPSWYQRWYLGPCTAGRGLWAGRAVRGCGCAVVSPVCCSWAVGGNHNSVVQTSREGARRAQARERGGKAPDPALQGSAHTRTAKYIYNLGPKNSWGKDQYHNMLVKISCSHASMNSALGIRAWGSARCKHTGPSTGVPA